MNKSVINKFLIIFCLLFCPRVNASHGVELKKCPKFLNDRNIAFEHKENMDQISVSISVNQKDDFDPNYRLSNSSESYYGFTNWSNYDDVSVYGGWGNREIISNSTNKKLLDIVNTRFGTILNGTKSYHEIKWHDKNGNIWETRGLLNMEIDDDRFDGTYYRSECTFFNGFYTDQSLERFIGYNKVLKKYFAAVISIKRFYKTLTPEF